MEKQNNTKLEQIEWNFNNLCSTICKEQIEWNLNNLCSTICKLNGISTIYVLQFVKYFTVYYIKCVCPRIWVTRVYVQELR
jgi:hypothetical protein